MNVYEERDGTADIARLAIPSQANQDMLIERQFNESKSECKNSMTPIQEQGKLPNALYLVGSQYLRKEELDPCLIRSPSRGGFLIPFQYGKVVERYKDRFDVIEIYDSIVDESPKIQQLSSFKYLANQRRQAIDKSLLERMNELGLKGKDFENSNDIMLSNLRRDRNDLTDQINQLDKEIKYAKGESKQILEFEQEWDDPIPLKEDLLPVAAFREEMLPEALRLWIMDCANRMQVPLDFLAIPCVTILGSIIGRKIGIYPRSKDDWLVIPNLWGAIVGRPAMLKTPAISAMMRPLEHLVQRAIEQHKLELETYERESMVYEAKKNAQKEKLKKAAIKSSDLDLSSIESLEKPPERILRRYKTEDATVEKLGEILLQNPQGILLHRDEIIGWLKSLEKYGHEGDRAFFLESWSGNDSFTVDRIGRGTLQIPALCLSIIGGIQPGPLKSYVHQAISGGIGDDGLLQRFQLIVWPDAPKSWKNIDCLPNYQAQEKAYEIYRRLDAFVPFGPLQKHDFKTLNLRFSNEAQAIFDNWISLHEPKVRSGESAPALESHLSKYRSLMPSLALIFYLVKIVSKGETSIAVGEEEALLAVQWCDYLETHARRLYASAEDSSMEAAKALLDKIKKGHLQNGFSLRDIYHAKHWAKLDTIDKVKGAIRVLEEYGWIRIKEIATGGRPTTKVIIHPTLRKDNN